MDKKITWGIIALVAVLIIVGIVFVVDREEVELENGEEEMMEMEGEDLLWDVEDELFYAYDLIFEMEDELDEEEADELFSRYDQLENDLWDLEDDYFEGEISDEEFEEGLEGLLERIQDFVAEIEA